MKKKIKKDKILLFTSQLNSLLKSGLTIAYSISILLNAETDENFKKILKYILKNLNSGKNIFDSFKPYKDIFGYNFIYMLKIGELSGTLTNSLDNITAYLEYNLDNKRKIISLLIYPIIVFSITIFLLSFLLIFIFPNFISIFEENNIQLPIITKILLFISNYFIYLVLTLILILLSILIFIKYINNNKDLKIKKDKFILNIYILGDLLKLSLAEEIYYSLYTLLNSGINLTEGLDIVLENSNNLYIKSNLGLVKRSLNAGQNIAYSLKNLKLFNELFSSLIQSGEESGFLAETFLEISKILKKEYEYRQKKYIALIEPFSIIFLGGIVSFIVFAIYIPIFSIGNIF